MTATPITAHSLQVFNPFPAPLAYRPQNQPLLGKQMLAFYHQCQLYGSTPDSVVGRIIAKYSMDLSQKNLCYANTDHSKTFQMMKVKVKVWNGDQRQDWKFTILENGNDCVSNFTLLNDKAIPCTKIPYALLNGNEFEIRSLPDPMTIVPKDKTWDHWKEELGFEIKNIREVIFLLFHRAIAQLCKDIFQYRGYSILDVGGCDGDLAFFLLDDCERIESYTVVEKSASLSGLAAIRSQCNCEFLTSNRKKLKAVQADATETELLDATGKNLVDVIILSGFIAEDVLTKEQSFKVMNNCKRVLKDRGFVIVAAYSRHHFGASDYEKMGFTVHNKSYSFPEDAEKGRYATIPFYVVQKSDG